MDTSLLGNVTGALLLGGESKRMGRDKAHLDWQGEVWSTRAANLLASLFAETLLVGGTPEKDAPGCRVSDPTGPHCALRGIVGALDAATSPRVLIVATDLPLLSADLLLALCAWPENDAVVPKDDRGVQPLCAIYRREACLEVARTNLESGRLSMRDLLANIECSRVTFADLGLSDLGDESLTHINTPEDLATLEVS